MKTDKEKDEIIYEPTRVRLWLYLPLQLIFWIFGMIMLFGIFSHFEREDNELIWWSTFIVGIASLMLVFSKLSVLLSGRNNFVLLAKDRIIVSEDCEFQDAITIKFSEVESWDVRDVGKLSLKSLRFKLREGKKYKFVFKEYFWKNQELDILLSTLGDVILWYNEDAETKSGDKMLADNYPSEKLGHTNRKIKNMTTEIYKSWYMRIVMWLFLLAIPPYILWSISTESIQPFKLIVGVLYLGGVGYYIYRRRK